MAFLRLYCRIILILVIVFPACAVPARTAAAEDQAAVQCLECVENRMQRLPRDLQILEDHYLRFRWAEFKIRRLFFDDFWRARLAAYDPLSKEQRKDGDIEEKRLQLKLRHYEKTSTQAANNFIKIIHRMQVFPGQLASCDRNPGLGICQGPLWEGVMKDLEMLENHFNRIFENEREFRLAVEQSAGSRKGLYPQDVLESPVKHGNYFERFERERASRRFQDDAQVMDLLSSISRTVENPGPFSSCCLQIAQTEGSEGVPSA